MSSMGVWEPKCQSFLGVFSLKVVSLQAGSLCGKKEGEEEPAYMY